MKKVNPEKDFCEHWKRGDVPHTLQIQRCLSCFYALFAFCWYGDEDKLVNQALVGNEEAKRELHSRIRL